MENRVSQGLWTLFSFSNNCIFFLWSCAMRLCMGKKRHVKFEIRFFFHWSIFALNLFVTEPQFEWLLFICRLQFKGTKRFLEIVLKGRNQTLYDIFIFPYRKPFYSFRCFFSYFCLSAEIIEDKFCSTFTYFPRRKNRQRQKTFIEWIERRIHI